MNFEEIKQIDKNIMFASYAFAILEMFDENKINYWEAYEFCFNEHLIEDIKKQKMEPEIEKALLLMSEYDTCKSYLSKEETLRSKEKIKSLLITVIERRLFKNM